MSTEKFHNKYRVQSARAIWHDYSGGKYFITISTKNKEHYFGEIVDGVMRMSALGKYADKQLRDVSSHYLYAEIPFWVVMPNHIHAVVIIDGNKTPCSRRTTINASDVETMCTSSLQKTDMRWKNENVNEQMQAISQQRGLLSTAIGGLKRAVSVFANQNAITFAWQPRFHDRIIRTTDEMNRIAYYIENNVAQWQYDDLSK